MISLSIDASDVKKGLKRVAKFANSFPKEFAASINQSLRVGKASATSKITGIYNVSGVNIGVKRASAGNLKGSLEGKGGMKHVSEFGPSVSGRVVSVSIIRGSRKAIISTSRGPGVSGAFMVGGRVMERRSSSRYPIAPVMTIGVPQMLGSKKVSNPVRDEMAKVLTASIEKKIMAI